MAEIVKKKGALSNKDIGVAVGAGVGVGVAAYLISKYVGTKGEPPPDDTPSICTEGDTRWQGGLFYGCQGGKWVLIDAPEPEPPPPSLWQVIAEDEVAIPLAASPSFGWTSIVTSPPFTVPLEENVAVLTIGLKNTDSVMGGLGYWWSVQYINQYGEWETAPGPARRLTEKISFGKVPEGYSRLNVRISRQWNIFIYEDFLSNTFSIRAYDGDCWNTYNLATNNVAILCV